MRRKLILAAVVVAGIASNLSVNQAQAFGPGGGRFGGGAGRGLTTADAVNWVSHSTWGDYMARNQAMQKPWHGNYYYLRTGQPTALIVAPTVTMQQNYSWGVSQNTMTPVYHQFGQGPSGGGSGGQFRATPYWPSHTDQFGIYPVRSPW